MNPPARPTIGITAGDPAGIGPEIVVKALAEGQLLDLCRPVIIGDLELLRRTCQTLGGALRLVESADGTGARRDVVEVHDLKNVAEGTEPGQETAATGVAAAAYIEEAVRLWRQGTISAIATAPISKNALKMAAYRHPGHTEFLAELTDTREFAMSFFADRLRVVLLSTHVSLKRAIELVKAESLKKLIRFSHGVLPRFIGQRPRIAVAGLNPHASEGGMFGREEADEITPAIEACREEGIDVTGPYSPDTVFLRGYRGEFDLVVSCYHDQATIAVKSLSFGSAVNVTLGLPLIRTSVDHGTAFDIAGKGIADASSMRAAIRLAAELASRGDN